MKAVLKVSFEEDIVRDDNNFYVKVTPKVKHVRNVFEKKDVDKIVREIKKEFAKKGNI